MNTLVRVATPVGGVVYSVEPRHMDDAAGSTLATRAACYGTPMAHEAQGRWYEPGGPLKHAWHEIVDLREIAILERAVEA